MPRSGELPGGLSGHGQLRRAEEKARGSLLPLGAPGEGEQCKWLRLCGVSAPC